MDLNHQFRGLWLVDDPQILVTVAGTVPHPGGETGTSTSLLAASGEQKKCVFFSLRTVFAVILRCFGVFLHAMVTVVFRVGYVYFPLPISCVPTHFLSPFHQLLSILVNFLPPSHRLTFLRAIVIFSLCPCWYYALIACLWCWCYSHPYYALLCYPCSPLILCLRSSCATLTLFLSSWFYSRFSCVCDTIVSAFLSCYYCTILTLLSCSRSSCARDDIHTALVIVLQLYYSHDLLPCTYVSIHALLLLVLLLWYSWDHLVLANLSWYYCDFLSLLLCSRSSRVRAFIVLLLRAPSCLCYNCASLAPLSCSCYNCATLALVILTCCLFPWFLVVILLLTKVTR